MPSDWILIANASRARVLQREGVQPSTVLHTFEHVASRLHSSELGTDERGRQASDRAYGGNAFASRVEPQRKEHLHFASELADFLEAGAKQGQCAHVHVFAASPFLGEIKAQLGSATQRVLAGCHDLDLSAVPTDAIDARIAQATASPRA